MRAWGTIDPGVEEAAEAAEVAAEIAEVASVVASVSVFLEVLGGIGLVVGLIAGFLEAFEGEEQYVASQLVAFLFLHGAALTGSAADGQEGKAGQGDPRPADGAADDGDLQAGGGDPLHTARDVQSLRRRFSRRLTA